MALPDDFSEVLEELDTDEELLNQSFTIGDAAVSYPCIANKSVAGASLEPFGYAVEADLVIVVRANVFPLDSTVPKRGQTVTLSGEVRSHTIDSIGASPGRKFLRLFCKSTTRGA